MKKLIRKDLEKQQIITYDDLWTAMFIDEYGHEHKLESVKLIVEGNEILNNLITNHENTNYYLK